MTWQSILLLFINLMFYGIGIYIGLHIAYYQFCRICESCSKSFAAMDVGGKRFYVVSHDNIDRYLTEKEQEIDLSSLPTR
jgi:hypothetical protein